MTCQYIELLSNFLSALLGGLLAIISSIVAQHYQYRKEKNLWLNEKRVDLYADLISLLDSIEIRVQPIFNESLSIVEVKTEVDYVKSKLAELTDFLDNNNGKLFLYLPKGVNGDLMKLRGSIYSVISDEQKQTIDLANFKNSEIYKIVEHAIKISETLKHEIDK